MLDGSQGGRGTVLPEVSRVSIAHEPLADDGGDEQQYQHRDVEEQDPQQE